MTTIALMSQSADLGFFKPLFQQAAPDIDILTWPDPACLQADVAVCWDAPRGVYQRMPNLKLVHSIAAGIDNVVAEQQLGNTPVCRVVDPLLAEGMWQFVLWGVLLYHRKLDLALQQQRRGEWKRPLQTPAHACRVGVMGLGELGGLIAGRLPAMGYEVHGWARTPREIAGVTVHSGNEGLPDFLASSDVLVCLLPLTAQTRGILGRAVFDQLPRGAALIHCGRGAHLVESDLVAALDGGQLRGALVDVFAQEPLPAEHALWRQPGVIVTPHMATMAGFDVVVEQIVRNVRQVESGQAPFNAADLSRGY